MPAVSRAQRSTRAVSTRRLQQEEGHCRHLGGPGHGSQCAPTTTAPGGCCGCGSQRASATIAIWRAVGMVVTRLAVLLDPGDSAFQVVSTPAPRGYLGRNCPFTEDPPGISRPTRWALAAQSLRATSSSSASGAGAFSLKPSKYFPEMPSNSSATARYVLGWAARWGLLTSSQKMGPAISQQSIQSTHIQGG